MNPTGLNQINCGSGDELGAGLAGCKIDRKRVVTLGRLAKGTIITDVSKAAIRALQQNGLLKVLPGVVSFVDNTPEDGIRTADGSGIKSLIGKMPYEYLATFDNGVNFNKALNTMSGEGDLIMWDADDVIWMTQNAAGEAKGYATSLLNSGKYMGQDGKDAASQTLMIQLAERNEIDKRMSWVTSPDSGASDFDDYNNVNITIEPIVDGDTNIVFTPKLGDLTHLVEGLVAANVRVKVNGTVTTSTLSYTTNPGKVTLTVAALNVADVVTVELYDSTVPSSIILTALGVLYKSNVATAVVGA